LSVKVGAWAASVLMAELKQAIEELGVRDRVEVKLSSE